MNGLVVPAHPGSNRPLFYRTHRKTSNESIDRTLGEALIALPARLDGTVKVLFAAREDRIEEPETHLTTIMEADPDYRPFSSRVLTAYQQEPNATRFGLVQAITLDAQSEEPDTRLVLESFAGRVLHGTVIEA
jgi:hypothetical protein